MKLAVEFASVSYREGPAMVARLAKGIEEIGYDQLDVFDHVVMGHDMEGRGKSHYAATMPILEALMTLSYAAAVTERIGLGTEVLILPQRQPVLVAKQFSTLDTLSGGRARFGIGVGWQASEYEALGERFQNRGKRMDEAIELIQACWRDERIDYESAHYRSLAMAMEPKPPQGAALPIWIGGNSPAAFRRIGKYADGWLASQVTDADFAKQAMDTIRDLVSSDARVHKDPEPFLAVSNLGDSSVDITVRVWAQTEDYWAVNFDTIKAVKQRFDAEGIGIPFPSRTIYSVRADD